ncbi:conserved hypothetical protein [Ricinus communis]|uniref:Uncharacterized protein n=1 Tax=Ricinus communis TaxID=3988 RepID=B9T8Z4_RICCO|nr:conserved hypothetical protein [Ricinus communis]
MAGADPVAVEDLIARLPICVPCNDLFGSCERRGARVAIGDVTISVDGNTVDAGVSGGDIMPG